MVSKEMFLTEKQKVYAFDLNDASVTGGWCKNATVNPSIAHAMSVRASGGQQRAGVSNFIDYGRPLDYPVDKIKKEINMERIRKLTPCECWRLQGFSKITKTEDGYEFDDTLFRRAESVNSNTQLYKQAGNSITVNVLEHIFTNLFITMSYDAPEGQMTFNEI